MDVGVSRDEGGDGREDTETVSTSQERTGPTVEGSGRVLTEVRKQRKEWRNGPGGECRYLHKPRESGIFIFGREIEYKWREEKRKFKDPFQ